MVGSVGSNFGQGKVLLHGQLLHFGYEFEVANAPGMRVLLSQHVAPDTVGELDTEPKLDIGPLLRPIGPQSYRITRPLTEAEWNGYRSVVLFSEPLKRVIARSQIRKAVNFEE